MAGAGPLVAGVDLGGTKIQTVVLTHHRVVGSCRMETPRTGAEAVMAAILKALRQRWPKEVAKIEQQAAAAFDLEDGGA